MIFWLIVGAFCFLVVYLCKHDNDLFFIIAVLIGIILSIVTLFVINNQISAYDNLLEQKAKCIAFAYAIENKIYKDDFQSLMVTWEEINEYNESIIEGRKYQDNFWIGIFYPDIYDEFEVIELNEESSFSTKDCKSFT